MRYQQKAGENVCTDYFKYQGGTRKIGGLRKLFGSYKFSKRGTFNFGLFF